MEEKTKKIVTKVAALTGAAVVGAGVATGISIPATLSAQNKNIEESVEFSKECCNVLQEKTDAGYVIESVQDIKVNTESKEVEALVLAKDNRKAKADVALKVSGKCENEESLKALADAVALKSDDKMAKDYILSKVEDAFVEVVKNLDEYKVEETEIATSNNDGKSTLSAFRKLLNNKINSLEEEENDELEDLYDVLYEEYKSVRNGETGVSLDYEIGASEVKDGKVNYPVTLKLATKSYEFVLQDELTFIENVSRKELEARVKEWIESKEFNISSLKAIELTKKGDVVLSEVLKNLNANIEEKQEESSVENETEEANV